MGGSEPERLLAGRYRLRAVIGQGGMGAVWRARDELLNRDVAVKEIIWPSQMDPGERETARLRAVREAQMAARMRHPNVVGVYDFFEEDGRPCIVMELVPYRSLREAIREDGPLSPADAARLGLGVLTALRAIHDAGVLHRDVKPANILLGPENRVVLTDFGIAKAVDSPALTVSGVLIGSPSYIAPERARGGQADEAADLWALGASLYTAVEGRPPFDREGVLASLTAVVADEPDPPTRAGPLWPAISGLLRKDPDSRLGAAETELMLSRVADGRDAISTAPWPNLEAVSADPPEPPLAQPEPPAAEPAPAEPRPPEPELAAPELAAPELAAPELAAPELAAPELAAPELAQPEPAAPEPAAPELAAPELAPPEPAQPEPLAAGPAGPDLNTAEVPEPAQTTAEVREPERPVADLVAASDDVAPRAAAQDRPAHRPRTRALLVAAAVAIAAIATVIALVAIRTPGHQVAARIPAPKTSASASASAPAAVAPTPSSSSRSPAPASSPTATAGGASSAVPAGYYRFTNSTGFSIGVPSGWPISHVGHYVYITDPSNSGIFLLIDQSDQPKSDPLADWQQQAANRGNSYPDYHLIRLQAVVYPQAEKAADWEFSYDRSGVQVQILNRNVLANARHAYALYWSTPVSDWNADYHYFQTFAATFRPASVNQTG